MKHRFAFMLAALASALPAQSLSPSEQAWNELARRDMEAALSLIERNHPGASPELGDTRFQALLAAARANGLKRIPLVKDYFGHAALMNGLANEFRDGHIWSNALLSPSRRTWAGIVMARRGGKWIVAAQERAAAEPDLSGAELLSCDGIVASRFARERTGTFYAHPDIEADLAGRAYTLLLDDQNPFVSRAVTCRFKPAAANAVDHKLEWRPIPVRELEQVIGKSISAASAGMGLSKFAGGYWIGVESFSKDAAGVVEQIRARAAELRASPMVVLDVRGNSGGNSQYAVEIARALVGDARTAAAQETGNDCNSAHWRVSADNAAALRKFANSLPADRAPEWTAQAEAMEQAVSAQRDFSPDLPACARQSKRQQQPMRMPPAAMTGRLILVTDRACFSSCLLAANLFRRLGALHVGEATDMSTRYMEVREITLPSGLRTFSTLQKVALGETDFGPYVPAIVYPGSLADTDALKAWVAALPTSP